MASDLKWQSVAMCNVKIIFNIHKHTGTQHTRTCTHTHNHAHTHMHVSTQAHIGTHIHAHTDTHTHAHTQTHTHMHTNTHTHIHTHTWTHTHTCMCSYQCNINNGIILVCNEISYYWQCGCSYLSRWQLKCGSYFAYNNNIMSTESNAFNVSLTLCNHTHKISIMWLK